MNQRILYIEDHQLTFSLIRKMLKHTSYELLHAPDAATGFQLAVEWQPHLILTDLFLPDMMGCELIARLKQHPVTAGIPVIALTADTSREREAACQNVGCDRLLYKPVSQQRLLTALHKTLGDARQVRV